MPTEETVPVVPATPANSETGNAPGTETPVVPANSGEKLFTQADLDAKIDDRLKRERAKAESAASKAAKDAEEAQAVKQGEYQKLAEDRKVTIEQLTPKAELADKLSELFTKQLDAELATWPEEAQPLVLPADSPLLARIESADRARPIAQKLLAATGQPVATPGTAYPAQHAGSGGSKPASTKEQAQATLKRAYAPRKAATQGG